MKSVKLTVNGIERHFIADEDRVLLDLLREDLSLTGAKQSCDRKGQCGACMVIVNGKAVLSCLTKVSSLDGAQVITIEGLGTPDNPHLIQEAFVLAGAVQCGFCTPGMILTAFGLLTRNPNPMREHIIRGMEQNLCRCGAHTRIIDAIQAAAVEMKGGR